MVWGGMARSRGESTPYNLVRGVDSHASLQTLKSSTCPHHHLMVWDINRQVDMMVKRHKRARLQLCLV